MILGLVQGLGIKVEKGTRLGDVVVTNRQKCCNAVIMRIMDDSLLVEGARLYNSVSKDIRKYNGSYQGLKNLVDAWLSFIPDFPRITGFELDARNRDGNPSNSIRD